MTLVASLIKCKFKWLSHTPAVTSGDTSIENQNYIYIKKKRLLQVSLHQRGSVGENTPDGSKANWQSQANRVGPSCWIMDG